MPSTRNRAWADTRMAGLAMVAGTPIRFDLLADAPNVDTLTAVRIVGDVTVQYTVSVTVTDSLSIVDLGIGVSSNEAFAVSSSLGLPKPSVTSAFPPRGWLYVASQPVFEKAESTGIIHHAARFQFDLRAMRKVDKGTLFLTMEQANITLGGSMQVTGRVRVLCLT